MKAERWQRINDLFQSATGRAPEERSAFLDQACRGDKGLHREVASLIASYERAENFIESPALEIAPELLIEDERVGALVGESIGHYRIESLIGVGGMGEVYLARDERLGRKVALKFLPQSLTADEAQLNCLEHEARTASALNHPNILTVHEIGVDGSRHFIATEFIEGETLRAVLARGQLDLRDALNIAIQVGSALAAAHKSGVLHRDIKPENIMLRPDGYAKVLDFGIAKLTEHRPPSGNRDVGTMAVLETRPGLVIGTAHYMSPEQARGQTVDARTDIWSFGAVLFEMLAGRPPFAGETPRECLAAVLKKEPSWLALEARQAPARLEQIIRKALRKDKKARYQSVEEMLADLRRLKEVSESITSGWKQQKKITAFLATSVAVALVVAGLFIYLRPTRTVTNTLAGNASLFASVIPEKSVAVLPFKNLSNDQESARFADGVQDEILTGLAKIADLRVISRTSVMQYTAKRNLAEIAQALGVTHVLEASVQRMDNRVRVNARLVDARTDAHLWSQTYDRDLAAVFAIQSDIIQTVAGRLHAKILPVEQVSIEEPPTADLTAFDFYTRAKALLLTANPAIFKVHFLQAGELLNQAVARDPGFFLAYCQLAFVHDRLYMGGYDPTPERLALAEKAIQTVVRLRPDDGKTHLALAQHFYNGYRDYDRAHAEITFAKRTLPNDPHLFELASYIDRRQGRWEESTRNLSRTLELDPRNFYILHQVSLNYQMLRRYSEMAAPLDRALAIAPQDVDTRVKRSLVDLHWRADTRALRATIEAILAKDPRAAAKLAENWVLLAFCERDLPAAERALLALTGNNFGRNVVPLTRNFGYGLLARLGGDTAAAHTAFAAARGEQEEVLRAQPAYPPALCVLGLIDAALGRKEEALREGRRAIEMLPLAKDAVDGSEMIMFFSITAAWAGEKDLAIEQLKAAGQIPGLLSYGLLKLHPFWDPLRGDPRFEKIVASLAPKE